MEQRKGLNSNAIKLIAILAMTIDHIAWAAFPGYPRAALPLAMHLIGRITCPVMCYFIAEGYHYTRDVNKYTARLFAFAVISHFAYIFASNDFSGWRSFIPFSGGNVLNQTSVMWSLAWGLVMLRAANSDKLSAAGENARDNSDMPCELPERLELHCFAVRSGIWHQQGRAEKAGVLAGFLRCDLRGGLLLRDRSGLRPAADGRCAGAACDTAV